MTQFENLTQVMNVAGWPFEVGDLVINFNQTARIIGLRADGKLVLQANGLDTTNPTWGQKWVASPEHTRHVL